MLVKPVTSYDISGKFINQISVKQNKETIDIKSFKSGVYTLRIVTEKRNYDEEICKELTL